MLFRFGKLDLARCSFCKMVDQTSLHLYYNCTKTILLWNQLKEFISNVFISFPSLMPQSAILGHIDLSDDYLLINHLILIYKFYIYSSRNRGLTLSIWKQLLITKSIEEEISKHESKERSKYLKKWRPFIGNIV